MLYAFGMGNQKLLIADDSDAKQMMLTGLVHHHHWMVDILTASSTIEAKQTIDKNRDIAFAFVDYEMPTENGPAVIAYLKKTNPAARIVLVSSDDNARYQKNAKEAGAEKYICTSYQSDVVEREILAAIEEWRN